MPRKAKINRDGIAQPYLLPSGAWHYRVRDALTGDYIRATFKPGPEDAKRATPGTAAGDSWAKETVAKARLGLVSSRVMTLKELMDAYIAHKESADRSSAHVASIRQAATRCMEEARVSDLTDASLPAKVQHWLKSLKACRFKQAKPTPATARTKNKNLARLQEMGNWAVKKGMLLKNPFASVDKFTEPNRLRPVFSIKELRTVVSDDARFPGNLTKQTKALVDEHQGDIEAAAEALGVLPETITHRLEAKKGEEDPRWLLAVLAAYTGLRSETLRGLKWSMVDWDARVFRIPAEITKTNTDMRASIQPELFDILCERHGVFGTILPVELAEMDSDRGNRVMQSFLRDNGIEPKVNETDTRARSLHAFRHSTASLLTATGLTPFLAMDAIGHTNTATSKHYAKGAREYLDQIKAEGWTSDEDGVFYLRRTPPALLKKTTVEAK